MPEQRSLRLNAPRKRALKTAELARFVSAVGWKSARRNSLDPNARQFDPGFSRQLRRMQPQDFNRVFHGDED